jgi:23S rRNA (uracil1939-C5)-methyltransferase
MQQQREPLEPARTVRCHVALDGWTSDGLAYGTVQDDADPSLKAGTRLKVLGGIPGEVVVVDVYFSPIWRTRQLKRRKPPLVRLIEVVQPAPERVSPLCPVFGDCGGCRLQHVPYAMQLAWKRDRVAQEMATAGLDSSCVRQTVGMDVPWHFRNQMRFAVNRAGEVGLTALDTHRVIPLMTCPISHPSIDRVLAILRASPQPRPQVLVRCGDATGEILLQPAPGGDMAVHLAEAGINVQTEYLREALHGMLFTIRPSSFFQTNTVQANVMADLVLANVPAGHDVTVADAYCGVGTFASLLAQHAGHVIAIEESASAVSDARDNLRHLGLENVVVMLGKTENILPGLPDTLDAIVLDPPRMGCQRPVIDAIIARNVPRIVYVSCDPATLARDLALFCGDKSYQIESITPLDMFPQTHHIEAIAVLNRNTSSK